MIIRELVALLIHISYGQYIIISTTYVVVAYIVPIFKLNSISFDPETCLYSDLVTRLWWKMLPIFFIFTIPTGLAADITLQGPYVFLAMSAVDTMSFCIMMSGCTKAIRLRLWDKRYYYYALQRDRENGRHLILMQFYIYLLQLPLFLAITSFLYLLYILC